MMADLKFISLSIEEYSFIKNTLKIVVYPKNKYSAAAYVPGVNDIFESAGLDMHVKVSANHTMGTVSIVICCPRCTSIPLLYIKGLRETLTAVDTYFTLMLNQ